MTRGTNERQPMTNPVIPEAAVGAAAVIATSNVALTHIEALAKMEDMLARAAVLSVPAERAREIVAEEQGRAQTSFAPFSWDRISDQITRAAL